MQFLPRKWASGVQGVGRRGTVWKSEGGDEGRGEGGVAADATFPVSVWKHLCLERNVPCILFWSLDFWSCIHVIYNIMVILM